MLKRLFDFFVFTSLFIACCAVLMVHQAFLLFGVSFPPELYLFVFFGSVCSYNFHWYLTPPQLPSHSPKLRWNLQNRPLHAVLAIVALAGAAACAFLLRQHWLLLLITAVLTFLYSAPMIPFAPFTWLRKIALAKTIYLAAAWTHITAALPLLMAVEAFSAPQTWYLVNRFFFLYAVCIVFDRRDRESDRKAGIRSLITWFSEKGVDRLFWASLSLAIGTGFLLHRWLPLTSVLCLLLPALLLGLLYQPSKQNRSDYLYYFLLDGLMALSAPILLLTTFAR